ncbi:Protein of unknown function [Pyronema omphalodes CBS 100304]|uniref:Uncharacterized protein n=1 Tax=Pyronema omphalodes (strain CBS 100304) TaxID=1076935 RepID=U4L5R5_PYROM|nr:Protein of unknown function [Pyronema omphalodes CBS 100304]
MDIVEQEEMDQYWSQYPHRLCLCWSHAQRPFRLVDALLYELGTPPVIRRDVRKPTDPGNTNSAGGKPEALHLVIPTENTVSNQLFSRLKYRYPAYIAFSDGSALSEVTAESYNFSIIYKHLPEKSFGFLDFKRQSFALAS